MEALMMVQTKKSGGRMTPSSFNEWIRLVVGPVTGVGLAIYLSLQGTWQPYEPPLIALLIFGPSIVKGPEQ